MRRLRAWGGSRRGANPGQCHVTCPSRRVYARRGQPERSFPCSRRVQCSIRFRRGRDGFSVPDGSHPHIRQACSGTRAMQQQARGGVGLRMLYCLELVQTAVLGTFAERLAPLQLWHSGQGGCRSWPSDFAVSADICRLNWSLFFSWAVLALPARPLHSAGEAMEAAPSTVDNDPCTLHVSVKVVTSPQVSHSPLGQLIAP